MTLHAAVVMPIPDVEETTDELHKYMSDVSVDAAKAFVLAGANVINVLTGGSRAAFLKLAFQAKVSLSIAPRKASRIPLGIETSTGEVFTERGVKYGFEWTSDLYYIGYVDARFNFVELGVAAVRSISVQLPPMIITYK